MGFRRNSEEFRNSTELKRHNKRAGKRPARHAIPPSRWKLHYYRFCLFRSCRLSASCLLCGRLPHRAPLVFPGRPRADKNNLATLPPPTHTRCLVGEFTPPLGCTTESRPLLPSWRQRTSTRQNNKSCSSRSTHIVVDMRSTVLW